MKKVILLIISLTVVYNFIDDKSSLKEVEQEKTTSYKSKVTKIKRKKTVKEKKEIIKKNKKLFNAMMIHFFESHNDKIKRKLSDGDYNKLKKIINKVINKKELNERDMLVYDYLKKKKIIKSLQLNNLKILQ